MVIIVLKPAVLTLNKGVILTVVVLTTPDCLAGFVNSNIFLLKTNCFELGNESAQERMCQKISC